MSNHSLSSLKNLTFDRTLLKGWNAGYMKNIRLIVLFLLTIVAIGIASFTSLPRRLNPEVKLTIVRIATVLPGAGPSDVESLVTQPLEDKLGNVKGIDTMTSVSRESLSLIVLQFLSSVDKDKARNDVQTAVNEVTTLPSDAKTPSVAALDFEDRPIWTFALTGNTDTASLMRFSKTLKDKITEIPGVDRVELAGYDTQQIEVVLNQQKIREYGVNPLTISQAVKTAVQSYPAGTVKTDSSVFSLSLDAAASSIDELRNIHITVASQPVRLGDIATIRERSKPDQTKSIIANETHAPTQSVQLSVYKTSSSDIDATVKKVEAAVEHIMKNSPKNLSIVTILNTGEEIGKQFTDLVDEFKSTIILVFINLFLFLGLRQALIACMTIPLTFLMSFVWMSALGQTINFISLFALLLAFGTSIDDTIVTVSAVTAYYRTKKFTPLETGLLVWRDFVIPIWTTTVTTVWAFLPLILSTGIIGEFIKPIPLVVATTMYSSTFVAWFITLPMMLVLLSPAIPKRIKILGQIIASIVTGVLIVALVPKTPLFIPTIIVAGIFIYVTYSIRRSIYTKFSDALHTSPLFTSIVSSLSTMVNHGIIDTTKLGNKYERILLRILASPRAKRTVMIMLTILMIASYSLIPLGLVKNEFFPKTNGDTLYVSYELPAGTSIDTLTAESTKLLAVLRGTKETQWIMTDVGQNLGSNGAASSSQNSTLFTCILVPKEKRTQTSGEIASGLRKKLETYSPGNISVSEESSGPPAGADIQIKLLGTDLTQLESYALKTQLYLKTIPGVVNTDISMKSGTGKLVFVPDYEKLSAAGVSLDSVGLALRIAASGLPVDSVTFDGKDSEDIVFFQTDTDLTPESLNLITVQSSTGAVPLVALGSFELKQNPTVINREGGKRTVSISAGALPGYSISDINKKLVAYVQNDLHLADGYEWKTGGINDENAKSVASIFKAMILSFILIMATMVIEFRSYRQAAMILILIPFAISGVFIVFGLTGTPLSFPALIGVLALFGVVVTNAMFIVEKINQNLSSGMSLNEGIADASQSRLEPIMLTSLTSILGLVPITLANPLWRGLGGAIISGLLFSGIIMLLYIPVLYSVLFGKQKEARSSVN
jgi:HAE1 family hydrophobic/amphiphilic exporter-1